MNLADYLSEDLVILPLRSRSKPALFQEMVDHLVEQGYLENAAEVIHLLQEREKLMSTGIKRGFAIPHAFTRQMKESRMMVGISDRGVDFQALDDEPVYFVFLLLGPPGQQGLHMRLLARLSRIMNQDDFYGKLETADTPQEVLAIIVEEERNARFSSLA